MSCNIRESAEMYRTKGFGICTIKKGEKLPKETGWTLTSKEPHDFCGHDNIGILTGTLSGDLVCVDLDHPDALMLADEYLPETGMIDGRPGRPRSHWWYRVTNIPEDRISKAGGGVGGPATRRFFKNVEIDGEKTRENLIDFLGTGAQAIVPPSTHDKSGEQRIWYCDGEPAVVEYTTLMADVEKLASACGWAEKPKSAKRLEPKGSQEHDGSETKNDHQTDHYNGQPLLPLNERVAMGERFVELANIAVSGAGGHPTTYRVMAYLQNDLALPRNEGRVLLDRYNERVIEAGEEGWSTGELDHKWDSFDENPDYPRGAKATIDVNEPFDDPHRLAREFLAETNWVYFRGLYYRYCGNKYQQVPEKELKALLNGFMQQRFAVEQSQQNRRYKADLERYHQQRKKGSAPKAPPHKPVTRNAVGEVVAALESQTLRNNHLAMPGWLLSGKKWNGVALENGLLDLKSRTLQSCTPNWFSDVCLPYSYIEEAKCEKWLHVLNANLEGDHERIAIIQEFFGYCLLNSTDAQRCLIIVGRGGDGKSVTLAGLQAVLGEDNYSTLPLEAFGVRFSTAQTLGKLANICAEIGELDKTAEGTLKAYISGDRMSFEKKYSDSFTASPTARLVLSTNNIPRFSDKSEGIWRRIQLVPFNRPVPDDERIRGMDKPEWWLEQGEVPGMFLWALEGLERLLKNKMEFTKSEVCQKALEDHRRESDPARDFLFEHYQKSEVGCIAVALIYKHYKDWCEDSGVKALSKSNFGKQVRRVFNLSEATATRLEGRPQKAWRGLQQRNEPDEPATAPEAEAATDSLPF